MKAQIEKISDLQRFLTVPKFEEDEGGLYAGIKNKEIKSILISTVAIVASYFVEITENHGDAEDYQKVLEKELNKLESIKFAIDTEDKEKLCEYLEELMNITELESSGGILNKWLYDFEVE